jgi:hypothetical protein
MSGNSPGDRLADRAHFSGPKNVRKVYALGVKKPLAEKKKQSTNAAEKRLVLDLRGVISGPFVEALSGVAASTFFAASVARLIASRLLSVSHRSAVSWRLLGLHSLVEKASFGCT